MKKYLPALITVAVLAIIVPVLALAMRLPGGPDLGDLSSGPENPPAASSPAEAGPTGAESSSPASASGSSSSS